MKKASPYFKSYDLIVKTQKQSSVSEIDKSISEISNTYPWTAAFGGAVRSKHTKLHGRHLGLPGANRSISTRPPKHLAKKVSDGRTSQNI